MEQTLNSDVVLLLDHVIKQFKPQRSYGMTSHSDWIEQPLPSVDIQRAPNPQFEHIADHLMDPYLIAATKLLGAAACTNALYYPGQTMMAWHTNSNRPGRRLYYTRCDGECCFAYIQDGSVFCETDQPGWNTREFTIPKDGVYWHTVWTSRPRYSFGFIFDD